MWERADGSLGGPDMYSLQAVRAALAANGESCARRFARFADANRRPAAAERSDGVKVALGVLGSRSLGPGEGSGWMSRELDHLSSTTLRFTPTGVMTPTRALTVNLDLADTSRGSLAVVTPYAGNGSPLTPGFVSLNRIGVGSLTVPLLGGNVSRIEVTLVNASTRTNCWRNASSPFSCFGVPRDDNLTERVRVVAVR